MAQDLTDKKANALSSLVAYAIKAEAMSRDLKELGDYFTDNGFASGGANAIVDGDCTGTNKHLSATIVFDALTAIGSVVLSTTNATRLRKTALVPTLPGT